MIVILNFSNTNFFSANQYQFDCFAGVGSARYGCVVLFLLVLWVDNDGNDDLGRVVLNCVDEFFEFFSGGSR